MTTVAITTADHTSIAATILSEQYQHQFRSRSIVQAALTPAYLKNLSKAGVTAQWSIFAGLDANATALDQGADFAYTQPTDSSVTATVAPYQQGVQIDGMTGQATPGDIAGSFMLDLMGLAVEKFDLLGLTALRAGGTHVYGGDATKTSEVADGDDITGALVKARVTTMRGAKVPTFENGLYRGFVHPYVAHDIFGESSGDFGAAVVANDSMGWRLRRLGVMWGVEWFEAPSTGLVSADAGDSVDVYYTPIFGVGALGMAYAEVEPYADAELEIDLTGNSAVGPGLGSRALVVRMTRDGGTNAGYYRLLNVIGQLGFSVVRSGAVHVIETHASIV